MSILGAIAEWVRVSSGLATGQVYWSRQRGETPPGTCIAMTLDGEIAVAQDWLVIQDAADPQPGADLEFVLTGPRVSRLVLECLIGDQSWMSVRPDQILSRVLASRNLPTRSAALRAAGIGFGPIGPVQSLNIERASIFDPRARVELAIHTISEVSELGTWIETVAFDPIIDGIQLPQVSIPPEPEASVDRSASSSSTSGFTTGGERVP